MLMTCATVDSACLGFCDVAVIDRTEVRPTAATLKSVLLWAAMTSAIDRGLVASTWIAAATVGVPMPANGFTGPGLFLSCTAVGPMSTIDADAWYSAAVLCV